MLPTEFSGKTWIFYAQALILGCLGTFSLICGPLFLFGVVKPANGKPGTDAGIALSIIAIPLLLIAALAVFNILARRRPIIRILPTGIEVNQIGCSSLDAVPLLPGLLRVAWLIVSRQGFRQQLLFAPWESFSHAMVVGPVMSRTLIILGKFCPTTASGPVDSGKVHGQIAIHEVAFTSDVTQIAAAINEYSRRTGSPMALFGEGSPSPQGI